MKNQEFNEIPAEVRLIVPFAKWFAKHPIITNIIITLELLAFAWVVFTYNFTTNI